MTNDYNSNAENKQEPIIKINKEQIKPISHLTEYEKKLWDEVVNNHPIGYFEPYHGHLITQYCKNLGSVEDINLRLELHQYDNAKEMESLYKTRNALITNASSIATRFRLTIQSSTSAVNTSNTKKNNVPAGAVRPWET